MDETRRRAWWFHRQGLDGSLDGATPAAVLERSGWARGVGGANPYLTLFARAGIDKDTAEAAAADLAVHELPSARGCTYVLPAADFALGLTLSRAAAEVPVNQAKKHLGVTDKELSKLEAGVVEAVDDEALDPKQLKERLGTLVRNLGEEGKKRGSTTTLPMVLGRLQSAGEIRRVPVGGRLDTQSYSYVRWTPNPVTAAGLDEEEARRQIAARFFRWTGPATMSELRWFTAFTAKAAKDAVRELELRPLEDGSDRLLLADDVPAFHSFTSPGKASYALVASIDSIFLLRRNVASLLAADDLERQVLEGKQIRNIGGLLDLPNHGILDRGRLIGLWDYDLEDGSIAWTTWVEPTKALHELIARTEAFVRDQLGDARSFSLDGAKARAPRVAALRRASW